VTGTGGPLRVTADVNVEAEIREDGMTVNAVLPSVIDTPANRRAMPRADPSPLVKAGGSHR
jgi:NAD(P)-dependent dehydrogenase (short-subunit alcohol dehydrogenase family)